MKHFILATAGHVDHGKTTLIKALTGTDTDCLPEEKARGITIDLGFAHLTLGNYSLGVIDVPGHEDFVRNMIAGLGAIDLALLVVAADDGWMPQTEEHLQILDYLGVTRGVVAITKGDLHAPGKVREAVRERLQGSSFGAAPIVITAAPAGTGLTELKDALAKECEHAIAPRAIGKPRLLVDRAFTVRGSGTVVTGTLSGGELARGASVVLQPRQQRARVRALQNHNHELEVALLGMRVAVNLPDVRLEEVPRGTVITTAEFTASRSVDVLLRRSARSPERALRTGAMVQVHHGSGRHIARVRLLDRRELKSGEETIARLSLAEPVLAFVGDRLVLRDASARSTIGGGTVLDADAAGIKFRARAQRELLRRRATAPHDLTTLLASQLQRDGSAWLEKLLAKSNFSSAEIARAAETGGFFRRDGLVADASWWRALLARAAEAIDAAHKARPNEQGLELTQLRSALALKDENIFPVLVAELCAHEFARVGSALKRRTHQPALPPQLQKSGAVIRAALAAKPFDPPSRKELARDAQAEEALRFLASKGEAVLLNGEVALSASAFAEMKARVTTALRTRAATASELRQLLGTSRRVLIPFLEHLDKIGLTRRDGDRRRLR